MNVSAYLERIEYRGPLAADYETFEALHIAHATHIPFENLDILLGRRISIDMPAIEAKLVNARRGGYCFEQNTLFAAVLRELGFRVTALAARVRSRQTRLLPRTHMCLCVQIGSMRWIADVGFGGEGLLMPVPMNGETAQQYLWQYRLFQESDDLWVLQSAGNGWNDLYAFTLEPQHDVDFVMANYYVSTYPESPFVRSLTVQLPQSDRRQILRNRELVIDTGNFFERVILRDDNELLDTLSSRFRLEFPAGTQFRFLENAAENQLMEKPQS
jgi:N-hydroxyarylamine O-acetyltransferase